MDISEIRRTNLLRLLNERYEGKQVKLADALERQSGYISRCLSTGRHRKRIGEDFARHIEKVSGLEPGWLDKANPEAIGDAYRASPKPGDAYGQGPKVGETIGQHEVAFAGTLDAWDDDTPLGDDEVELPLFREVGIAGGTGNTQVIENHGAKLRFAKRTLRRAGVMQEHAACAFVDGDSMEPILPDGATVGVNTQDTTIKDGKMYVIDHGGLLRVKFLYRLPGGGLRIRSANPDREAYPDEDLGPDWPELVRVIGKVFWYSVLMH